MVAVLAAASVSQGGLSSAEVVKVSGRDAGLCVLIGCGAPDSPALAAELAASGKMAVHGIALDDASLARGRKAAGAAGVEGPAMIERLPLDPLAHRDNMANLVVADADAAAEAQRSAGT